LAAAARAIQAAQRRSSRHSKIRFWFKLLTIDGGHAIVPVPGDLLAECLDGGCKQSEIQARSPVETSQIDLAAFGRAPRPDFVNPCFPPREAFAAGLNDK
jgi:hypothetical protein